MADGKLTYDIDFNVHSESISDAIVRAVGRATSSVAYNKPTATAIDAAVTNLGERLGAGRSFYKRVATNLGFSEASGPQQEFFRGQGVNSLADFASLATSQKYGYTPSTTQTIINSAIASALRKSKKKPDMQWKFEMESLTNDIRAAQKEQDKASLAYEYSQQGLMFANAAAQATTPEAQKMLLGRAANRYASIASRTLIEAGAVTPDDATIALSTAAELGSIRSGIKTTSQLAAARDKDYERMEAIKAREEAFASKKAAQEDAAWATRDYGEDRKQRDMERGFKAMGARSATESAYSADRDPDVQRWNYGASLYSAAQYAADAEKYPAGSAGRMANIELAKESMRGITISGMAKSGMHKDELTRNTAALLGLTEKLKQLAEGDGGDSGGPGGIGSIFSTRKIGSMAAAFVNFGWDMASEVAAARTQWLKDTSTPWMTRRAERQRMAAGIGKDVQKGGAYLGGATGAAIGTAILPGVGTVVGALGGAVVGSLPGGITRRVAEHYSNEREIANQWQDRVVAMKKYRDLYGSGAEYNYAQLIENMGYASVDSVMGLTKAADMLPGAMMFGAVGEDQMMALSYMPNYWRAMMSGASTSELFEAYAYDINALPKQVRQYITSLLPGVNEELRAFAQSGEMFGVASNLSPRMRYYDRVQEEHSPGWIRGKTYSATQNAAWANKDFVEETANANSPNYFRTEAEWKAAMAQTANDGIYVGDNAAVAEAWNETRRALNLREFDNNNTHGKLGDIIIQIDGSTIHQEEYSTESFIRGQQTHVVGV